VSEVFFDFCPINVHGSKLTIKNGPAKIWILKPKYAITTIF
jgi:hypothetical protein